MKKIYLLSAVACMFTLSANADWVFDTESGEATETAKADLKAGEWFTSGANATGPSYVKEPMQVSGATTSVLIKDVVKVAVTDTGDAWATQFCYVLNKDVKGFEAGVDFQLNCDVYWKGPDSDTVQFNLLTGKLLDDGQVKTHDDWQWSADANKELVFGAAGEWNFFWSIHNAASGPIAKETWTHVTWPAQPMKIGDAGWLGIQLNLANKSEKSNIGNFFFANMTIQLGTKTYSWFNTPAETTAINDAAAIKAFVANDVLYASEAADVVIYNINGVAVKSAKNAINVNVSDLKAGLYIAKVGNATIKFVK